MRRFPHLARISALLILLGSGLSACSFAPEKRQVERDKWYACQRTTPGVGCSNW